MAVIEPLQLCLTCHSPQLSILSKPATGVACFKRTVPVKRRCQNCSVTFEWRDHDDIAGNPLHSYIRVCEDVWFSMADRVSEWWERNELVPVYLPKTIVAAHRMTVLKHHASAEGGSKPTNYRLTIANLLGRESEAGMLDALCVVAPFALSEEYGREWHERGCLPYCSVRGTPWVPTDAEGSSASVSVELLAAEEANQVAKDGAAYVEGGVKESTIVVDGNSESKVSCDPLDEAEGCGQRVAHPRFPTMSSSPAYLFSNNPQNLASGEGMRNVDFPPHSPYPAEARKRDKMVDLLCKHVFTKEKISAAMLDVGRHKEQLPKKFNAKQRENMVNAVLRGAETDGVGLGKTLAAFVKAEVTSKAKPRTIVNHGEYRVTALATVAYLFEKCLFNTFKGGCIKGRAKRKALTQLCQAMNKIDGQWVENDLTGFEYGIGKELKRVEQLILSHIAKVANLDLEEIGFLSFNLVNDERTNSMVWEMLYKDDAGVKKSIKIKLPRAVRESGDRLTSSGNWLQNLVAWFCFLVDEANLEAALLSYIKNQGGYFHYVSARDGVAYKACLAFEGDDTAGRLVEKIAGHAELFFQRWGWKPKLKYTKNDGDEHLRFVGYDILLVNGKAPMSEGEVICCPEIRRILTTKQWTTMFGTPEQIKGSMRLYAASMAEEFVDFGPMHAFFRAMHDDSAHCKDFDIRNFRNAYCTATGSMGDDKAVADWLSKLSVPAFRGSNEELYERLAIVSAGPASPVELAEMSSLTTLQMHGSDLAAFVPKGWVV